MIVKFCVDKWIVYKIWFDIFGIFPDVIYIIELH